MSFLPILFVNISCHFLDFFRDDLKSEILFEKKKKKSEWELFLLSERKRRNGVDQARQMRIKSDADVWTRDGDVVGESNSTHGIHLAAGK